MKKRFITTSLLLASSAGSALAGGIGPDTVSLQEVTVSAIKQGTNVRSLAISASELRQSQLERNGITGAKKAAEMVPNIFIPDYGSRMTSTIYMRGLGTRIDQPAMGLNVDNVPVMCKENYDFDLMDIARVEVLRGPQSTLFGRNTMAGVMNIYTLSPLNYSGTRAMLEYASRNTYKAGASIYRKFNGNLGLSFNVLHSGTDGEFRNEYNGKKTDWEKQTSGRLKVEWMPQSNLFISNMLSVSHSREGGYAYEQVGTGHIAYNDTCFYRRTAILDGLTIRRNFEHFSLSGITSYQYLNDNMTLDQDFTVDPYFTLTQARREHAVTEDIVARSTSTSAYQWLMGAFGFYRHYNMDSPVTFKDKGISELIERHRNAALPSYPIAWDSRNFVLGSNFKNDTWGAALYHQSTYALGDFTLAAGLRIDYEHATLNYHSETHTGYTTYSAETGLVHTHSDININDHGSLAKEFFELLPKLSITYHFGGEKAQSVYASFSKGSKSGGFNTQMFSDVLQQKLMGLMGIGASYDVDKVVGYKPEIAWNYEVGGHFECWNHRIRTDVSAFFLDCRDRQLTVFPDGTTTGRVMTNAGKTHSWGAEFAMQVAPGQGTVLNASYGYTHATFAEYNDGKADHKGRFVPYSPSHTLFVEAAHTFSFASGSKWARALTIDANLRGTGKIYWNEANDMYQPFYCQLGASATLTGDNYSLELWGKNLTGTKYNTFYFVSIGHAFLQRGRGTSIGATLRINI
ncbi:MAG: TonB-dependent receptor [Bacteroidales bacterium]|nr:TonB-dependent receptor [Bacteroidales bacterium]